MLLTVTPKARSLLRRLTAVQRPVNDALFHGLSAGDFALLGRLMPRLVESGQSLLVALGGLRESPPRVARTVRDGLVDGLEIVDVRGQPSLRVTFSAPPESRKVSRLREPHRLVLDFYRTPVAPPQPTAPPGGLRTIVIEIGRAHV